MKRQATDCRDVFENTPDTGLLASIYKEHSYLNNNKQPSQKLGNIFR